MKTIFTLSLMLFFASSICSSVYADECQEYVDRANGKVKETVDAITKADFFYSEYVKIVTNRGPEADRCFNSDKARKGYWLAASLFRAAFYNFDNASHCFAPYGEGAKLAKKASDSADETKVEFNKYLEKFNTLDSKMRTRCSLSVLPVLSL